MLKNKMLLTVLALVVLVTGCTVQSTGSSTAIVNTMTPTAAATVLQVSATPEATLCQLKPIVVPTLPAKIPGYTDLDETTGLHVTGTYQMIDLASYRLKVTGKVDHPLSLTYDDIRCMPKVTANPSLVCVGFFEDVANWSGVPLKYVLGLAGIQAGVQDIALVAADGYQTSVPIQDALKDANFLAYELEGKPLPILHGFPLRAVFPGVQGNKWVKWLVEIKVE